MWIKVGKSYYNLNQILEVSEQDDGSLLLVAFDGNHGQIPSEKVKMFLEKFRHAVQTNKSLVIGE